MAVGCQHGRDCFTCPNKMLATATECLREAAHILNSVHYFYDGITVKGLTTWIGDTKAEVRMSDWDRGKDKESGVC